MSKTTVYLTKPELTSLAYACKLHAKESVGLIQEELEAAFDDFDSLRLLVANARESIFLAEKLTKELSAIDEPF